MNKIPTTHFLNVLETLENKPYNFIRWLKEKERLVSELYEVPVEWVNLCFEYDLFFENGKIIDAFFENDKINKLILIITNYSIVLNRKHVCYLLNRTNLLYSINCVPDIFFNEVLCNDKHFLTIYCKKNKTFLLTILKNNISDFLQNTNCENLSNEFLSQEELIELVKLDYPALLNSNVIYKVDSNIIKEACLLYPDATLHSYSFNKLDLTDDEVLEICKRCNKENIKEFFEMHNFYSNVVPIEVFGKVALLYPDIYLDIEYKPRIPNADKISLFKLYPKKSIEVFSDTIPLEILEEFCMTNPKDVYDMENWNNIRKRVSVSIRKNVLTALNLI